MLLIAAPIDENEAPGKLATGVFHGLVAKNGDPAKILTTAEIFLVGSATLVAVMVTLFGDGATAGAVYSPVEDIVPQRTGLQSVPERVQVAVESCVPVMVAVNC